MIENKSVRIKCDFCHKVVAVKKFFGFRTLKDYCTIGKEHVTDMISDGHKVTVYRCQCRECGMLKYIHFDEKLIIH